MNWRGILGMTFIGLALVLGIISLATLGWLVFEDDNKNSTNYGLVQVKHCSNGGDTCTTKSIDCGSADTSCKAAQDGGKQVIACGIVSLVVAAAGFGFTYLAYKRSGEAKWRRLALSAWVAAGALAILAVILYSKKTVMLDYSFILYLFASFVSVVSTTAVLIGPGVSQ